MAKGLISTRLTEEAISVVEDVMLKHNLNRTEAIQQIILSYEGQSEIPGRTQKGTILRFIANFETIMNNVPQSKGRDYLMKEMEEFKCQMLSW